MGRSNISGVLNDFFKEKYEPTILGSIHLWEKREGLGVGAADAALMVRSMAHHESGRSN
jgi:hypothetical protein